MTEKERILELDQVQDCGIIEAETRLNLDQLRFYKNLAVGFSFIANTNNGLSSVERTEVIRLILLHLTKFNDKLTELL